VPFTVALHCEVAFTAMVEGVQTVETEEMVEDGEPELLPPPPQAPSATTSNDIPKACLKDPVARWRPEPAMLTLLLQKADAAPRIYRTLDVIKDGM
jgi:hypothetical protein